MFMENVLKIQRAMPHVFVRKVIEALTAVYQQVICVCRLNGYFQNNSVISTQIFNLLDSKGQVHYFIETFPCVSLVKIVNFTLIYTLLCIRKSVSSFMAIMMGY